MNYASFKYNYNIPFILILKKTEVNNYNNNYNILAMNGLSHVQFCPYITAISTKCPCRVLLNDMVKENVNFMVLSGMSLVSQCSDGVTVPLFTFYG